jgi:hypothetical protein
VYLKGGDEKCFDVQEVLRRGEKCFSDPVLWTNFDGRFFFPLGQEREFSDHWMKVVQWRVWRAIGEARVCSICILLHG